MTDNIITARLFIDMDGTLAAWQQAACFEDLLQENYFRDLPPYQTVVDAVRILCNAHPELDIYALSAFMCMCRKSMLHIGFSFLAEKARLRQLPTV